LCVDKAATRRYQKWLGFFTYYSVSTGELNPAGPVPIDSIFIYRPDKRIEIWRFLLYMMLHAGWLHLGFNLVVQLLVGLPLEMVHGSGRVALIYMAGVVAGSLGTSVFDTDVYLVGASGGVYALLAAHLANVLLNYNNMQCGILRLFGILAIGEYDEATGLGGLTEDFSLQPLATSATPSTPGTPPRPWVRRCRTWPT
jgi:rhomboid-related protein 1/2/3